MYRFSFHRRLLLPILLATTGALVLAVLVGVRAPTTYARPLPRTMVPPPTTQGPCTRRICTFDLQVNPGLLAGKPFACPAIQNAHARITITNRFVTDAQNDIMVLTARGLPPNTGFDLFLVQNSPLDAGTFPGFGFGWYQSDLQSNTEGNSEGFHRDNIESNSEGFHRDNIESNSKGNAEVTVQGIFDKETFIENPADPFNPIHTFNVGFWFNSPDEEAKVCPSATPAKTPFNGEQNAGLLAMITQGEPLQFVG